MSKKVLITGVSGQAGSYFADYLLANTDYEIYGMVRRLSVSNHTNIEHLKNNPRFHLFSGDLNDCHSIFENIDNIKPDYFINCAAQSFVFESWVSPANTFEVVSVAIIHILEAIRKIKPECRFINFGSSEEMGDVKYSPQDENHPPRARSVYGAAKIAARQIIKVYRESYGLYCIQPWNFNYESERRGVEFITRKITNHQILDRLEGVLTNCFNSDNLVKRGIPTVQYIADALNVSPNYLSGLLKVLTGQSTQQHIHERQAKFVENE